ncbi:hypothetical protein Nham_0139 [Nitrobacter hamburgensis X14]|uniref:Replication protein n=1 Tax=Nitrobacter hamburgensis (strain DSM 10229 / NCIMB 13809 / X14) TaxID=323097 RepID=Q1QRV7_NITHX|nr:hypothetical protein Nham_0139 [Nitrobacter hamburgensis X14]
MVAPALACVNDKPAKTSLPRFRFVDNTERRAFGPAEHIRAVHPPNAQGTRLRRGFVVWGQKGRWTDEKGRERAWKTWSDPVGGNAECAAEKFIENGKHRTADDLYFSMQAFKRPNCRKIWNLAAIGCAYVDIDYKETRWKGRDPRAVLTAVLFALDDARMPPPCFVMDSGSGLHLVWPHNLVTPKALPRWNLMQDRIVETLKLFGADPAAKDAARVLRLSGSWNPNATRKDPARGLVHLIWIQGDELAKPYRYDFDELADEILPMTRAEIVSLRAERAKRRAESKPKSRKGRKPAARRDSASYAEAVLEDLHRLRQHRYRSTSGRLPAGQRDNWLFCAAMALSWITPAPALQRQIEAIAEQVSSWRGREARSRMGSIIKRAQDAAAGKTIEFDGKEVDPRYRMKAETIIKWLAIEEAEMRAAGLRVLLSPDVRRERKTLDARDRRKTNGATSHDDKRTTRIELGKRATWMHVRSGLTYAEIAAELGVSKATIGKAIDEAHHASLPTSENASGIRRAAIRAVYGGITPPKGGLPVPRGTGCLHPARTEPEKQPTTSGGGTAPPRKRTTAASGGGTGAKARKSAQRSQAGQRTGGMRKVASTSARHGQSDERHVPDVSMAITNWVPPRFLRRTG